MDLAKARQRLHRLPRVKAHHIGGILILVVAVLWPYKSVVFSPFFFVFKHVFGSFTKSWATVFGALRHRAPAHALSSLSMMLHSE